MQCEICGKDLGDRVYITFLVDDGTVLLTCPGCEPPRSYDIELKRFLEDQVNWMAHLSEKRWFRADKLIEKMKMLRHFQSLVRTKGNIINGGAADANRGSTVSEY